MGFISVKSKMSGNNPFDDILAPQPHRTANPFGDHAEPSLLDPTPPSGGHSGGGGRAAAGTSRDDGKHGYALDPFFDEQVLDARKPTDSSDDDFGQPAQTSGYMQPIASTSTRTGAGPASSSLFDADQPFAHEGAAPAGYGGSAAAKPKDYLGGGNEDPFADDDGPAAYTFSAPTDGPYAVRKRRGRWQRFKDDYLTDVDWSFGVDKLLRRKNKFDGIPREVLLNDPEGNRVKGYENNAVSTGKYGPLTFLPKFLFCELPSRRRDIREHKLTRHS